MIPDVAKIFDKLMRPVRVQISNLVARAVVQLVNDGAKIQLMQIGVGPDETRDGCERVGDYGFTSVPLAGAEAVVVFPNGRRDHGLILAVGDRRHRKTGLAPGEVALYHKDGAAVVLKADGSIQINAKPGQKIVLAGGTQPIARVGDTAGPWPIVGGNPLVTG